MHQLIEDTLSPLGIEIAWGTYEGNAEHYLLFSIYNEDRHELCDDTFLYERYDVTITYWFKKPEYLKNKSRIKQALLEAGFIFDGAKDVFDQRMKGIHFDFIYEKEKERF